MKTVLTTCAIMLCTVTQAAARDEGDVSVAFGVSTFGANFEATYTLNPSYRVRGALMGGFSYEASGSEGDSATYDGDFTLGGVALLGDFYPTDSGWRVSGGLFISNTELDALAEASVGEPIVIDGVDQTSGSLRTTANFKNEIAPIITTGYDLQFADGWSFNSEVGIVFTGGIELEATAGGAIDQSLVDNDPDYQDAQDEADKLSIYPYLGFSVSYQF